MNKALKQLQDNLQDFKDADLRNKRVIMTNFFHPYDNKPPQIEQIISLLMKESEGHATTETNC